MGRFYAIFSLACILPVFLTCTGSGSLSHSETALPLPPVDTTADIPRPATEYLYSELTDVVADIPQTAENFNFKTVVDTEISLQLRFYEGLNPVAITGGAVFLFRDGAGRLLWAGVSDAAGRLTGQMTIPATTSTASLYIFKDRFAERTITIENLGALRKLDRSLYLQKSAQASNGLQKISAIRANVTGNPLNLIDNDGDSVPDAFDDFPMDPARAFKIKVPAEEYFTISFEDLFPVVGDGDYNDFTGRYGVTQVLNAQNQLVEILGSADAIARLAGYRHRFGLVIRFPGYGATLDTHKTGASCGTLSSSSQIVTDLANINFFERTDQAFTNGAGHHTFFTLHFNTPIPASAIDAPPYDPYVFVHNTGKDVHLIGKPNLPGSQNPAVPVGFRDANGYPWAMLVPSNYMYPKEGAFIETAYPNFKFWRESLGQTHQDWYDFPVANRVVAQPAITTCTAALQVQSTIPVANEGLVPVNTVIRVFLNQSIDASTVSYHSVQVLAGGAPISGSLAVIANEIAFTPTYDLVPGTAYSVRITPLVKSVTGDTLQNDYNSAFSTELQSTAALVRELDIYTEGEGPVFLPMGNEIYFAAAQPNFGTELWKSDGTYHGTVQVRDIYGGETSAFPEGLTQLGGRVIFSAVHPSYGRELFSSDGSMFGTDLLRDIAAGATYGITGSEFRTQNSELYFVADDGTQGRELWKSDGVSAALVADVHMAAGSNPQHITVAGDRVYFTADDGVHGRELFKVEPPGAVLVKDLRQGGASSTPQNLTALGNKIYFTAYDALYGNELFESDGTETGTQLKADIYTGASSSFPSRLVAVQDRLFFTATGEGTGTELYCLAGENPQLTKDITPGNLSSYFGEMVPYGSFLIFVRTGLADGDEIWRSDCTEAGTYMVRKLKPGNVKYLTLYGGRVHFSADDGRNGQELWRTDGTFSGTIMVRNIEPGSGSSNPSHLTASGNRLYFRIYDTFSAFPEALWKYEP